MLSDRAVFVHNLYLRNLPSIPEDKCQRLGLSIAISKITEKPPVAVLSKPQTTRQQTVSANASRLVNDECQEWIKTVGSPELEDQVATIVGKAWKANRDGSRKSVALYRLYKTAAADKVSSNHLQAIIHAGSYL